MEKSDTYNVWSILKLGNTNLQLMFTQKNQFAGSILQIADDIFYLSFDLIFAFQLGVSARGLFPTCKLAAKYLFFYHHVSNVIYCASHFLVCQISKFHFCFFSCILGLSIVSIFKWRSSLHLNILTIERARMKFCCRSSVQSITGLSGFFLLV